MELTQGSETSANYNLTPGKYPKEHIQNTLQLLKPCRKGKHMDCWEALYMQALHHKQVLISEQQIGDFNPLLQMATITYTP